MPGSEAGLASHPVTRAHRSTHRAPRRDFIRPARKGELMTLNVMVIENESGVSDTAASELRAAGHTVLTCHEAEGASFPCRGVVDPTACPLHSHPVDVA